MLFKMLFETGCRKSELLGLPWRNVDFENKTIYIQQTLVALNSGGKEFDLKPTPKNESSKRYIPISDTVCSGLIDIKRDQQSRKGFSEDSLVFQQSAIKGYVQPSKLYQRFKQVFKKAGLDKELTIHPTRHTMATRLINSGISIPTIQKLGGWSTPDILLKVYAHTSQENVAEAVKLLHQ